VKPGYLVWFSIRDNDWQLPLIENHTRPNTEIPNDRKNNIDCPPQLTPWPY
jgi:hypothetical protein